MFSKDLIDLLNYLGIRDKSTLCTYYKLVICDLAPLREKKIINRIN